MQLLPAGVPRSFSRFRRRVADWLDGTPLRFVVAVVAIAVLFRAGVGLLRPAPVEEAPVFTSAAPRLLASAAPAVEAEPRTKAHLVDPPAVASGRLRNDPPPRRKQRSSPLH